jgi:S-adenosylmethionine decarboxylase proenzyme
MDGESALGNHIIVDMFEVPVKAFMFLSDKYDDFDKLVEKSIKENHVTLLRKSVHVFGSGGALTSLYLLSESHISFHTWPERGYIAMDVFTCGKSDTMKIVADMITFFEPGSTKTIQIERGVPTIEKALLVRHVLT